jgi:hypothetical protein
VCEELSNAMRAFGRRVAAYHELQKTTQRELSEWQSAPAGTTPQKPTRAAHR